MGHARALLTLGTLDQERIGREVAARQLSVRQTEALVRQHQQRASTAPRRSSPANPKDPDTQRLEQELSERVGAPVTISHGKSGGQLVIRYSSLDELDGIIKHLR
jgi:ParB family chromosome partitioning protein